MKTKIIVVVLLLHGTVQGMTIGSDTAVNRYNGLQTLNDGTRVAGFAALAGGFTIGSPTATATFDSFFSVSGPIDFNYGTLILNQDLVLNDVSDISTLGSIIGNYHNLELAPGMSFIPSSGASLGCAVGLLTTVATVAVPNTLDWNLTHTLMVTAMNYTSGTMNLVQIYSWNDVTNAVVSLGALTPNTLTSQTSANVARWYPVADWIAIGQAGGLLSIYATDGPTFRLLSSVNVGAAINDLAWYPTGTYLAVGTSLGSAQLRIYPVSATGVLGAATTVTTPVAVVNTKWNNTGAFLVIGTANNGTGPEIIVYSVAAGVATLDSSFSLGSACTGLHWDRVLNTNLIAAGTQTGSNDLWLLTHATGSLTQIPVNMPEIVNVNAVLWGSNGYCLAVGLLTNQTIGQILQYTFDNTDNSLTLDNAVNIGASANDVRWGLDTDYLAIVDTTPELQVYGLNANLYNGNNVYFYNTNLFLNSDITLSDVTITFTGYNSINGRGNILSMTPTFSFLIQDSGSLLLQNITINGVSGSNIAGLSNMTTVSLQDVTFVLSNNFTFSLGNLDILKDFKISGPNYAFIYNSTSQSIVRGGQFGTADGSPYYYGSLIVDTNVTFSYAPANNGSNLLTFESAYSKLVLTSGTLMASNLSLTNGSLQINGNSTIYGATGVTFGNGIQANNMAIEMFPAADLQLQGNIFYSNM